MEKTETNRRKKLTKILKKIMIEEKGCHILQQPISNYLCPQRGTRVQVTGKYCKKINLHFRGGLFMFQERPLHPKHLVFKGSKRLFRVFCGLRIKPPFHQPHKTIAIYKDIFLQTSEGTCKKTQTHFTFLNV